MLFIQKKKSDESAKKIYTEMKSVHISCGQESSSIYTRSFKLTARRVNTTRRVLYS